jgi:hypothetical protein
MNRLDFPRRLSHTLSSGSVLLREAEGAPFSGPQGTRKALRHASFSAVSAKDPLCSIPAAAENFALEAGCRPSRHQRPPWDHTQGLGRPRTAPAPKRRAPRAPLCAEALEGRAWVALGTLPAGARYEPESWRAGSLSRRASPSTSLAGQQEHMTIGLISCSRPIVPRAEEDARSKSMKTSSRRGSDRTGARFVAIPERRRAIAMAGSLT